MAFEGIDKAHVVIEMFFEQYNLYLSYFIFQKQCTSMKKSNGVHKEWK